MVKRVKWPFIGYLLVLLACQPQAENPDDKKTEKWVAEIDERKGVWLTVLGTVQDGGSPHPGCMKDCCKDLFLNPDPERKVVSLGVIDYNHEKQYLFEATPDITTQMKYLRNQKDAPANETPDGIFLTHAHMGHYSGLMYLGREALGADAVPVFAMPRMKTFLETNGPWRQLVELKNIALEEIQADSVIQLTSQLHVIPFLVPHRDEYSETVGYKIIGPRKSALFIPDINKWHLWERDLVDEIAMVDYAFLDATFFADGEINRDMAEVPHPFVEETMALLTGLSAKEKRKVYFIHFNHTNPLIDVLSAEADSVRARGFNVAEFGDEIVL
jgi:pyrroloquinoline quinone biosynthesis protein B